MSDTFSCDKWYFLAGNNVTYKIIFNVPTETDGHYLYPG
jgi:hypothetical protein